MLVTKVEGMERRETIGNTNEEGRGGMEESKIFDPADRPHNKQAPEKTRCYEKTREEKTLECSRYYSCGCWLLGESFFYIICGFLGRHMLIELHPKAVAVIELLAKRVVNATLCMHAKGVQPTVDVRISLHLLAVVPFLT